VKLALLWYDLFARTRNALGFDLNPNNSCVANKMVDGKQLTVARYMDGMKISHVDAAVVTQIFAEIKKRFGKMTATRGTSHVF
jgi:hypothetical protein